MKPVVVVGAGITGLAAARALRGADPGRPVVVVDAADRAGGKIQTAAFAGGMVELGPDAFIARVPEGVDLSRAVGLDDLVAPAARRAYLWTGGRLRPLPEGLVLGLPTELGAVARAGILSPAGIARAALDLVLPARRPPGRDRSVGSVVRQRFGDQVQERLVDPLLGGIHAGDTDHLSLEATAPQLAAVAARSRSLLVGLRRAAPTPSLDGGRENPVFLTPREGLGALVDRVAAGVDVRLGTEVVGIAADGRSYRVELDGGEELEADGVVLSAPAFASAALLSSIAPDAAAGLAAIEYASVALVLLAYRPDSLPRPIGGSGFLVPRSEGRLLTACSFASAKWPHWGDGQHVVFRASVGRAGDERGVALDDDALVQRVHEELAASVGVTDVPVETRVARWPRSFPQYAVGHLEHVAAVEAALAQAAPGIVVAGAAYRGVGIPACIAQGTAAARRLVGAPAAS